METTKVSFDRGLDTEDVAIYTMEYYPAIRKDEILPLATTWMDLENIMLIETSQSFNSFTFVVIVLFS